MMRPGALVPVLCATVLLIPLAPFSSHLDQNRRALPGRAIDTATSDLRLAEMGTAPVVPATPVARTHRAPERPMTGHSALHRDGTSCSDPTVSANGTQYTITNKYISYTFDADPNNPASGTGFPGDVGFDATGACAYTDTGIYGSIALSYVEDGTRYVYGTPNGEYGAWWSVTPANTPDGTVAGALTPLGVTQQSLPGQTPLVVAAHYAAGNVTIDWTLTIDGNTLSVPYSVVVTAPTTTSVSNVSLYHLYDLDDLNGGDSSPGADGLYQDGQLGSVNSLIQGIGIAGYNANWDLSVEGQSSADDSFQKVVEGVPFNNYPSGVQLATQGAGADGGLQFPLGTLVAGSAMTVGGSGGGTRTYGTPPAPQVDADDENWIATNSSAVPQASPTLSVGIKRFYGALTTDQSIDDTNGLNPTGMLFNDQAVEDSLGNRGDASVQLEAFGTASSVVPTISPCPANPAGTGCPLYGQWQPDPNAAGWSIFTANGVPASDILFPNLNLTDASRINPPFTASNTLALPGLNGSAIAWARIQERGVRPVVLAHGIAVHLSFGVALNNFGPSFASTDPLGLSGWTTWACWVAAPPASPCTVNGQTLASGYLERLGVPNIRPTEETEAMAKIPPAVTDPMDARHYPSDIRAYLSASADIADNARALNDQIAMVRTRYGVDKINIVTHSKGGLDASTAIETDGSSVQHLVMLAPPFIGTDLADYFATRPFGVGSYLESQFPALKDLTRQYWEDTNPDGPPVNYQTQYSAVAGTDSSGMVPGPVVLAGFGYDCFPYTVVNCAHIYTNDNAVPEYSAQHVPGLFYGAVPDNHYNINQDPKVYNLVYRELDLNDQPSVQPSPASYLDPAGDRATARTASPSYPSLRFGPVVSGSVPSGATVTETVLLPPNDVAHATLTWDSGALQMTLIDPAGDHITALSPSVGYTSTAAAPDMVGAIDYELPALPGGAWTAVITNTTSQGGAAKFQLATSFVGSVSLATSTQDPTYRSTDTIPITTGILDGGASIGDVTITATAVLSGAAPISATLVDNGRGTYAGSLGVLPGPGDYTVHYSATGTANGAPFAITGLSFLTVAAGGATLTGSYTEIPQAGRYGLYRALVITPTIQVNNAGDYDLQGTLVDAMGAVVASASVHATPPVGSSQDMGLYFDGATIAASGKNGPYMLRDITLTDMRSGTVTIDDRIHLAYTTAAYMAAQFGDRFLSILPGTTDMATDPNASGLFTQLSLAFTATAALPDTYDIVATLVAPRGQTITLVTQTVNLSSAPTQVTLRFSGADIAAAGLNGPYSIAGMTIVPESHPTTYVSYPGFWVTSAYRATTFGPPSVATPTATAIPASPTATAIPASPTATATASPASIATTSGLAIPTQTAVPTSTTNIPHPPTAINTPPLPMRATSEPGGQATPTPQPSVPVAEVTRTGPACARPGVTRILVNGKALKKGTQLLSGQIIAVRVHAAPRLRTQTLIDLTHTTTTTTGTGHHRKMVKKVVVVDHVVVTATTNSKGSTTGYARIAYVPAATAMVALRVGVRSACGGSATMGSPPVRLKPAYVTPKVSVSLPNGKGMEGATIKTNSAIVVRVDAAENTPVKIVVTLHIKGSKEDITYTVPSNAKTPQPHTGKLDGHLLERVHIPYGPRSYSVGATLTVNVSARGAVGMKQRTVTATTGSLHVTLQSERSRPRVRHR